jgi:hypothetical protein
MGDRGVAEMIPYQGVRHISEGDLSGDGEGSRPWVCPASRVEHGKNP